MRTAHGPSMETYDLIDYRMATKIIAVPLNRFVFDLSRALVSSRRFYSGNSAATPMGEKWDRCDGIRNSKVDERREQWDSQGKRLCDSHIYACG
ncbi:hypothetical protein WN51_02054 [Melipona quadrifasciata]|uniref:Uncharacterized protein n=1 Tax=Melipona quadrifasciata TaxID=166423 RepID=A0A0M8ZZR8_9HYME|nr:hypothetical protein WN51_02054 [Melipona quadrifasciata]